MLFLINICALSIFILLKLYNYIVNKLIAFRAQFSTRIQTMTDVIQLLLAYDDIGLTVREIQEKLQVSAKTARNLAQTYGVPGEYGSTGIKYKIKKDENTEKRLEVANKNNERFDAIRSQILDWLYTGNVDVIAWANDPLKRPPSYFIKPD